MKRRHAANSGISPSEFLKRYPEDLREISERLRDLVRSAFPSATEKVYTGWKLLGYRLPLGNKSRFFCCIVPQRNDVLLGFVYGIAMQDHKNMLEGKGTQLRFVRMLRVDQYTDDDLIPLIEQAARVALDLAR